MQPAEVKVGLNNNVTAEIQSGLNEGDRVVAPAQLRRGSGAPTGTRRQPRAWRRRGRRAVRRWPGGRPPAGLIRGHARCISLRGLDPAASSPATRPSPRSRTSTSTSRPARWWPSSAPSGSGKSTLMNILGCLDRRATGTYHFDGRDVAALGARRAGRAAAREFRLHLPALPAAAPTSTPSRTSRCRRSMPGAQRRAARARRRPARSGSASATGCDHRPSAALRRPAAARQRRARADEWRRRDPRRRADRRARLKERRRPDGAARRAQREGHTIIIVTHDPAVAEQADRIDRDQRRRDHRPTRATATTRPPARPAKKPMRQAPRLVASGVDRVAEALAHGAPRHERAPAAHLPHHARHHHRHRLGGVGGGAGPGQPADGAREHRVDRHQHHQRLSRHGLRRPPARAASTR